MDEFWNLTLWEIQLRKNVWLWHQRRDEERSIILAYNTAALTRTKRMPTLQSMLRRLTTGDTPPSDEEVSETKRIADEGAAILEEKRRRKKLKLQKKDDRTDGG